LQANIPNTVLVLEVTDRFPVRGKINVFRVDFIVARNGRIASVYLFFDSLP
jgi:hypothetical protein